MTLKPPKPPEPIKTLKLPKTIKIGGQEFSILYDDNLNLDQDEYGNTNFRTLVITLENSLSQSVKSATLLHEIIEIINEQNELNLPHQKIQCISNAIFQILSDNRDLV